MKKFLVLLLALFIMMPMLSGCALSLLFNIFADTESSSEIIDISSDNTASINAEELFNKTVSEILPEGILGDDGALSEFLKLADTEGGKKDNITSIEGEFSQFIINGADLTVALPIGLKLKTESDYDGGSMSLNAGLTLFGENLTFEITKADNVVRVTDLCGLNYAPIDADDLYLSVEESESTENVFALIKYLFETAPQVLSANITEESYSAEVKSVSIDGTEYEDATVITLSFPDGAVRRIAYELIDEIEKNQQLADALGIEYSSDTIIEKAESVHEIRVINTVVDDKCRQLVLEVATLAEDDNQTEYILTSMTVLDIYENGFKFQIGTLGANREISKKHEITTVEYSLIDDTEKLSVTLYEVYQTSKVFELNGKVNGNSRSGEITFKQDTRYITFDYAIELKENGGRIALSDFVKKGTETPSDLRYGIVLDYTESDSTLDADLSIDIIADTQLGTVTAVGDFDISIVYEDVIIYTPSQKTEEFDAAYYATTFALKYPNTYGFIQAFFNANPDNVDDSQISIDLPAYFTVYPGYDDPHNYVNYISDNAWVYVLRYDKSEFSDFDEYIVKHFAENIRDELTGNKVSVPVVETDGIYHFTLTTAEAVYDLYFFKGDDEFWEIQFVCMYDDYSKYKSRFEKWAKSVDPTGKTEYGNSLDDIIGGAIG